MELSARVQSAKANRVSAKARRLRINTRAEHDHVLVVGEPKARHPPFKMRGAASPGPAGKVTIFGQMKGPRHSAKRRNVGTDSQLPRFHPAPEGWGSLSGCLLLIAASVSMRVLNSCLQVTALSGDPRFFFPPCLHTLRTIASRTLLRRARAPRLLNARLRSSQAGGLLMATITTSFTPKECLLWSDRQRLASRLQVKRAETRPKLPRQTPGTLPSARLRAELGHGPGQGERRGEGALLVRGAGKRVPIRSRPREEEGGATIFSGISLIYFFPPVCFVGSFPQIFLKKK